MPRKMTSPVPPGLSSVMPSRLLMPTSKVPNPSSPVSLPENLLSVASAARSWNGMRVEVTEFTCAGQVLHRLRHEQETRLGVILMEVGRGRCEPRTRAGTPCPVGYTPRHMHFAPAGLPVWGFTADARYVKDVSLSFDLTTLCERLQMRPDEIARSPRLRFNDERIWTLARLLADAVEDPDPSSQLYGDALTTALAVRLLGRPAAAERPAGQLSPLQLRDALGFLASQLPNRVELSTLAALAGLSPSHYSRAFKASTGMAPYQWQLQARIDQAKMLLLTSTGSLERVAEATGFADAVHFGKMFRKLVGVTPAAWRAQRRG